MSCINSNFTTFNFVSGLNETLYINTVEENLKGFIDYALLGVGGFVNVSGSVSGLYSNSFSKLKPVTDPAFTTNTVWATPKQEWVWETGISYKTQTPINISGLFINSSFYPAPTGSGSIGYSLDYNNGQVKFNKPINANSGVSMNYSYKWCKVLKGSDNEARRILQKLSYKNINTTTETNHNVQLPCIIVESVPRDESLAFELGSLVTVRRQDFLLHIYTENYTQQKTLVDIFKLQGDKYLKVYDPNLVVASGYYGLNNNGSKNPSGLNYGQIINRDDLFWNTLLIKDVSFIDSQQNISSTLFWCIVRLTIEIIY